MGGGDITDSQIPGKREILIVAGRDRVNPVLTAAVRTVG
jgi:hypothetical protein